MARGQKKTEPKNGNGAKLNFEQTLWAAADKLRGHLDAAEYKHVVLGLIFLKYISDAFSEAADVIGKPAIFQPDFRYKTLVASLDISIVRPKSNRIGVHFLYCLFLTDDFQSHVYGYTNGSTVLHLGKDGVPSYEFVCPSQLLVTKFQQIAEPLFFRMTINNLENVTLGSVRDTLLPKLLSGEIRVKEAEKVLEAVT